MRFCLAGSAIFIIVYIKFAFFSFFAQTIIITRGIVSVFFFGRAGALALRPIVGFFFSKKVFNKKFCSSCCIGSSGVAQQLHHDRVWQNKKHRGQTKCVFLGTYVYIYIFVYSFVVLKYRKILYCRVPLIV